MMSESSQCWHSIHKNALITVLNTEVYANLPADTEKEREADWQADMLRERQRDFFHYVQF